MRNFLAIFFLFPQFFVVRASKKHIFPLPSPFTFDLRSSLLTLDRSAFGRLPKQE